VLSYWVVHQMNLRIPSVQGKRSAELRNG
jgi:hypothetical protein